MAERQERLRPPGPSVRFLFGDTGATAAVLDFLRDTRVGRMPGLAMDGFQGEESDLEEIELVASEAGSDSDNEEDGPARPRMHFPFVSFLCPFYQSGVAG